MKSTKAYVRTALMSALLCVLSPIAIPVGPIPVTLQTFVLALSGAVLGPWAGFASVIVYFLIGACGLPVFSGYQAGIGVFAGVTGGFLFSFPILSGLCGLCRKKLWIWQLLTGIAGLCVVYITGTAQLMRVTGMDYANAVAVSIAPFFIKDIISIGAAVAAARAIEKRISLGL